MACGDAACLGFQVKGYGVVRSMLVLGATLQCGSNHLDAIADVHNVLDHLGSGEDWRDVARTTLVRTTLIPGGISTQRLGADWF